VRVELGAAAFKPPFQAAFATYRSRGTLDVIVHVSMGVSTSIRQPPSARSRASTPGPALEAIPRRSTSAHPLEWLPLLRLDHSGSSSWQRQKGWLRRSILLDVEHGVSCVPIVESFRSPVAGASPWGRDRHSQETASPSGASGELPCMSRGGSRELGVLILGLVEQASLPACRRRSLRRSRRSSSSTTARRRTRSVVGLSSVTAVRES
jgi:hypothetical protein